MTKKDAPLLCFMKFGSAEKGKPTEKVNGCVEGEHADGWRDRGDGVRVLCWLLKGAAERRRRRRSSSYNIISVYCGYINTHIYTLICSFDEDD